MAFKTLVLLMACASYASAGVLPVVRAESAEYDPHPQYSYGYDIQDAITGDSKNHQEIRDGDVVRGQYSLNDADGTRRIVDYTADPINGFNAVVRKEPLVGPVVAQAAPVLASAPVAAAPTIIDARAAPVVAARAVAPAAPLFAPSAPGVVAARFSAPVAYSAAPAPLAYSAGAPLAYSAAAPLAYSAPAPLAYSAPGPLAYSAAPAPYARVASPLAYTNAYSAPLGYSAGPIAYSGVPAPLAYSSPIARLASPYNLASPFSPVY